jgi:hypothetical protein
MPDFTQWNVPSPFPNILYNPAAVDAAIARTQSELGNLDINQQELQLKKDEFARGQSFADTWNKSIDGTTGTTGAVPGGGGSFLGALAQIESGDKNIVSGTDKDNQGLTLAQGGNPQEISQGHFQIHTGTWKDFAPQAGVDVNQYPNAMSAPRDIQARVASVIPFKRFGPRTQTMMRQQFGDIDSNRTVGELAGLGPRSGSAAVAGPVAVTPPPATRQAGPLPVPPIPPGNPNAGPRLGLVPPSAVATTPPTTTGQADDPNTAAVKQASAALLNMPEPDAAAAYPAVVRELQARGFAMNAPPTYPGHAALQALVGGGDATTPDVDPSRQATRLGGVAAAGPAAGQTTLPPVEQPNRLYSTGLAGVTINGPGNTLAPPPVQTAAAPATAPPGATRPPLEAPPAAPTRVIPREPLIQSGPAAGLTRTQAVTIGQMLSQGAKPAVVMQHADEMRHQNDVIRQGDATQAAIEQQANYERRQKAEQTAYDRAEKAKADAIAAAVEKRAADKAAAEAADPLQGKSEDERIERTLLQLAPKVRAGQPLSDAEKDQYTLLWNKYREGPIQQVPDGKGGFFTARVPRDVPPDFPPPPGQKVSAGPQAIPGTEKQPDLAPPTITGGMLANGAGQRKIMSALAGLEAHPDAVGAKGNAPEWLLQRADPEGIALRSAVSNVAGHEFHDLSGAAVSPSEASRLKFIPSEKDTAFALKTKLQQMLDQNRETMLQSYRTYGPENNFRRAPAVEEAIIDSIPQVSIDMLKDKPETAKQFDKAFGKGAAKLVLQYGG